MGRPKKYATDAERQAAYRERYNVITIRLTPTTAATLDKLAAYLDVPRTEVVNSIVNFALLNRNWLQAGLFGKLLPSARLKPREREGFSENPIDDFFD